LVFKVIAYRAPRFKGQGGVSSLYSYSLLKLSLLNSNFSHLIISKRGSWLSRTSYLPLGERKLSRIGCLAFLALFLINNNKSFILEKAGLVTLLYSLNKLDRSAISRTS
jgi:hypothetical protein